MSARARVCICVVVCGCVCVCVSKVYSHGIARQYMYLRKNGCCSALDCSVIYIGAHDYDERP